MRFRNLDGETSPDETGDLVEVVRRLSALLTRRASDGLSLITNLDVLEWETVSHLYLLSSSNQEGLVEHLGVDAARAGKAFEQLVKKGLVCAVTGGGDNAPGRFELTAEGLHLVKSALPEMSEYFRQLDQTFTDEEKAIFIDLLNRVLKAAGP